MGVALPEREDAGDEELWESARWYMEAFKVLTESRHLSASMSGAIFQPLAYSEMRLWWLDHAVDPTDLEDLDEFVHLMRVCDRVFLDHVNKKPAK